MPNYISTIKTILSDKISDSIEHLIYTSIDKSTHYLYVKSTQALMNQISITVPFDRFSLTSNEFKSVLMIIRKLDPKKHQKYSYYSPSGDSYMLRRNIRYLITLSKISAFILVDTKDVDGDNSGSTDYVTLYFFGKGREYAYRLFINTLSKYITSVSTPSNPRIKSFTINNGSVTSCTSVRAKTEYQLFYDNNILKETLSYLESWKKAIKYFESINITQKVGLLLYGPPGTGKTSFATAIAIHFAIPIFNINIINFSENSISCLKESMIMQNYKYAVVLIEDIDCVFTSRKALNTTKEKETAQLLLQFLDGLSSVGNLICIATTNHKESLDPALIRDGRFDKHIEFKGISKEKAHDMCKALGIKSNTVISKLLEGLAIPINPSHLQNKALQYVFTHLEDINYPQSQEEEGEDNETF